MSYIIILYMLYITIYVIYYHTLTSLKLALFPQYYVT